MPKIDPADVRVSEGSSYPPPFDEPWDAGETLLRPGDSAGWRAGVPDGHHLQNRTEADAKFLVVGTRNDEDHGEYSDIDMMFGPGRYSGAKTSRYLHKNGTPY